MTDLAVIAGLFGAGLGFGLALLIAGLAGRGPGPRASERAGLWWSGLRGRISARRAAAVAVTGVATALLTGWLAAGLLAALAVWALPALLGGGREQTRRIEQIEAIASWTEMLRDTLVAAAGLEQAILATAETSPAAIQSDIRELAVRLRRGDSLTHALRELADDLADPTADLVVSALVLAAEHRARELAQLLGELATEAREQASMRLRIEADRAGTRTSVRVIVAATLALAAGLIAFSRDYLAPFDSPVGQLVLLAIGGLWVLAFRWLAGIAAPSEVERFLTPGRRPISEEAMPL